MRRLALSYWLLAVGCLLLGSCGPEGDKFRLSGRLRNINQGEFLVYSPDGGLVGIDTIKVRDGRFAYEKEIRKDVTLMLVFPNFSEQVIFAAPGEEVTIKGDATHLKEVSIKGTDENEELTKLRMRINKLTPPEIPAAIAQFIEENPTSIISTYLLNKYFVSAKTPNYAEGQRLTALMLKANPDNGHLRKLEKQLDSDEPACLLYNRHQRPEGQQQSSEREDRSHHHMGLMELPESGYPAETAQASEEIS